MRSLRSSFLFVALVVCAPAQDIKEFEKKVTEFTLPNGLHFVLLERHDAPVAAFHTFVNVGSADDPGGQTGMARIVERVAYRGTESIGTTSWATEKKSLDAVEEAYDRMEAEAAKGVKADPSRVEMLRSQARVASDLARRASQPAEYLRILEENGASRRNNFAGYDATSYAYSLPSNRIELWFLMESQRLMHPAFRDFYTESEALLNDYRKQTDSSSQGKLLSEFLATAFKVHPYRNPIGGWPGDLQSLRRNAAKEFFERYYVPGNITVAIVGDVNPAEAKRLAERYFAPMAARPLPPVLHAEEPPQDGPKTVVVESTGPAILAQGYKRPSQYDKDDPVFDVMQYLMAQGTGGLFYRDMVTEKHLAVQARAAATFPSGRYPSLMMLVIQPAQGRSLEEAARGIDEFVNRFKSLNVDAAALARAKAQVRSAFLRRIGSNEDMAAMLAIHHAEFGNWRTMFTSLADLEKVNADAVQRVATKYLVATGRTTAYTVQPGQSGLLPPAGRTPPADRKTGGEQ